VARDQSEGMAEAKPIPEMRALLDTNILIRHLTNDPPAQAKSATRISVLEILRLDFAEAYLAALGGAFRRGCR